ncbi:MAG: SpoIID/LytB domain-containing protein [Muribaculaceae bacterium]|nr:SpoIID/LytB domain-containing protein [Muribaculaceae bacterium]
MNRIISVGIATSGEPHIKKDRDYSILYNQLIGLGFHWERAIESKLPGEVFNSKDPVYQLINRLPLETYLECVVGSEMNPDAPIEFLKAHAVISRSWAMGKISGSHNYEASGKIFAKDQIITWEDTCDHRGFDVCADDHCQRYQGLQQMDPAIKEAIRSTAGLCLYSPKGNLVDTRFSKCCGGRTEVFSSCWQSREEECLESLDDPWCNLSALDPSEKDRVLKAILKDYDLGNDGGYRWQTEISSEDLEENLKTKFGRDLGKIKDLKIIESGQSGRAKLLRIYGEKGELYLGKELMIRRLLAPSHLYSSRITIQKFSDHPVRFLIEGRGWGHGVGLCQIGAARMALEGYDFKEILSFYYPGCQIR